MAENRLFASLIIFLATLLYGLEISPNLVYQIETSKYEFSYEFYIKNDVPDNSLIKIEIIDFITDGRNYSFGEPDYKYSLRNYVSLFESEMTLGVDEQKPVRLRFNVPQDFPGATGVFALRITQQSASGGKFQIRLSYIIPFFVRFTTVPIFQSIVIKNLFVRDLSSEPDDKFGDYGSLITLEIENNGNIAFIPKGSIVISSQELKTTITEVLVDSFDLVIFPERKTYYSFYVPHIMPSGMISVNLSGKSYGQNFDTTFSKRIENSTNTTIINSEKKILLFSEKNKSGIYTLEIQNLSPIKTTIFPEADDRLISFIPKKSILYPYRSTSFNVRILTKDFDFLGDRVFPLTFKPESTMAIRDANPSYIILRGKSIRPSLSGRIESSKTSSTLVVFNTGDCVLHFDVIYNNQKLNEEPLIIFPNQTINLDFGRLINKNQLKVVYGPYNEDRKLTLEEF
ncbi:MAG: hypothetical protein WHS64_04670 [Fervidobacterium sp.]|uniref:hypothetical protein n=1 Tax=Fervidobacterium sp. TaxID=1871331 RepID=UPI0030960E8F